MSGYAGYVVRRLGQFVLVVFVGISLIFLVTHLTPIDPVHLLRKLRAVTLR